MHMFTDVVGILRTYIPTCSFRCFFTQAVLNCITFKSTVTNLSGDTGEQVQRQDTVLNVNTFAEVLSIRKAMLNTP